MRETCSNEHKTPQQQKNTKQKNKWDESYEEKEMHYKCKGEWTTCKMVTKLTHIRT